MNGYVEFWKTTQSGTLTLVLPSLGKAVGDVNYVVYEYFFFSMLFEGRLKVDQAVRH